MWYIMYFWERDATGSAHKKKKKQTAPHIHTEVRYIRNESLVQIRE